MPYVKALEAGIKEENWILAVMGACTLPDICTSLEGKKNRDYYMEWFNTYVKAYQHTLTRRKGFIAKTLEELYQIFCINLNYKHDFSLTTNIVVNKIY